MDTIRSRTEAVLQGILFISGDDVYRTKLVKLTYLVDESTYRLRGETMTGLSYRWDNFGPNAENNEIVRRLDKLEKSGRVDILSETILNSNRNSGQSYKYSLTNHVDASKIELDADEWATIHSVIDQYGGLNVSQITTETKNTEPMRRAAQGESIQFTRDHSLQLRDADIDADPFWKETLESIRADSTERITLEEIRAEVAKSAIAR